MYLFNTGGYMEKPYKSEVLHSKASSTTKNAPIIRFRDSTYDKLDRTYDHEKITTDLIGKSIRVEIYSTGYNPELGYITGCYREIKGKVLDIFKSSSISFIIFEDGKVLDPYCGTDIKIEVL